ncbi:MAG: hypothetical protein KGI51_02860 [Rhodospirillales bacterium]|nr:hypothetical protein [Rhodospirillales bacterium]
MRKIGLAASLCLLAAAPAWADSPPVLFPSHDAAVTYRVEGRTPPGAAPGLPPGMANVRQFSVAWNAELQRLRWGSPGMPGYAIIDYRTHHMMMVETAQRMVMDVPFNTVMKRNAIQPGPLKLPADVTVTREGSDTVAGQSCTVWHMSNPRGAALACITADGIPLRIQNLGAGANGRPTNELEAVSVDRAPQPEALFMVPPGYRQLDLSHMGGPPGSPPPRR